MAILFMMTRRRLFTQVEKLLDGEYNGGLLSRKGRSFIVILIRDVAAGHKIW